MLFFVQDVVPLSDHQVALQLVNIVPGHYKFTLTVTDVEGIESQDSMSLVVQPGGCHSFLLHYIAFCCHVFVVW